MADVFISHQHKDRAAAERVAARLTDEGVSTWRDTSLVAGDAWDERIRTELKAARVVVVLWSHASWASRWVQAEATAGRERDCLVAARLDDVVLEPPFNMVQTADLRTGADGLDGLVEGVRRKMGGANAGVAAASRSPPARDLVGAAFENLRRLRRFVSSRSRTTWVGAVLLLSAAVSFAYWIWAAGPSPQSAHAPPPSIEAKSIAVLPFANLSPDKEETYFADGMADEIINILSKIGGTRVVSRTSSFAFKGKDVALSEIARQLSVRHVVEGGVRRGGDTIRISAKLIDVESDRTVWADSFERKAENVFAVQDDIARAIAGALNVELSASAGPRAAPTENMEAYRLYLKARELFLRRNKDDVLNSIELYKAALKLDRDFAGAHAGLAASYLSEASKVEGPRNFVRFKELAPLAQQAANAAIVLDPKLARAYGVLGLHAAFEARWEAANKNLSQALAIEPLDPTTLGWLSLFQLQIGEFEGAARTTASIDRLDPLYSIANVRVMGAAFVRGEDDKADAYAEKVARSSLAFGTAANWVRACIAQARGDHAAAEAYFRTFMTLSGRNKAVVEPVISALRSRQAIAHAVQSLREEQRNDPSFEPDRLFFLIGDEDAFLDALRDRFKRGEVGRVTYHLTFAWRLVAQDHGANPKLKALMRELGLVEYWRKYGWPDRCRPHGEDDFVCN